MAFFKALIFGALAVAILFAIRRDLAQGVSGDSLYEFTADRHPIGYALMMTTKALIVMFSVAEVLSAFGLIGDPLIAIRATMSFR